MGQSGQVVGYARVSTDAQHLDRQLVALGDVDKLFEERASGASRKARPALAEALRYVREGDTLRVHSIDRLARSLVDFEHIVDDLTCRGVRVEVIDRGLVFAPGEADPAGVLLRQMLAAVAQFERAILRERQREGIEEARKRGVYKGRKRALSPDTTAAVRRRAATGESPSRLAADYGVSRRVIYDAVHRRGAYAQQGEPDGRMPGEEPLPLTEQGEEVER